MIIEIKNFLKNFLLFKILLGNFFNFNLIFIIYYYSKFFIFVGTYNLILIFNLIVLIIYFINLNIGKTFKINDLVNEIAGLILILLTIIVSNQFLYL